MQKQLNHNSTFIYLLLSILFAIILRLLPLWTNDIDILISNPDGFYFANYTNVLLTDISDISSLPSNSYFAFLLYVLYYPFHLILDLNSFLFYITPLFASLIAIPIILISKELGNIKIGFVASLISTTEIYYYRTTLGRVDTDFLAVLFPLLFIYFTIKILNTIKKNDDQYFIYPFSVLLIYNLLYPSGIYLSMFLLFFSLFFIYVFEKDNRLMVLKYLLLNMIAIIKIPLYFKLIIFGVLYYLFKTKLKVINFNSKKIAVIAITTILLFIFSNYNTLYNAIMHYIVIDNSQSNEFFYNMRHLLGETHRLGLIESFSAISVNIYIFSISLFGLIWLINIQKRYLLLLPILILGFMVFVGGSRYGLYAWVILSFGLANIIIQSLSKISTKETFNNLVLIMLVMIYMIVRLDEYKTYKDSMHSSYTSFISDLGLSKNDNFLSSSRNGYMLSYYTGARSFIDGGRNSGKYQYLSSNIFLEHNQTKSYKMIKLLSNNFDNSHYNISSIAKKYDCHSPVSLVLDINKIEIKDDHKSNYIYITDKMFELMNSFHNYAYIDLSSGAIPPAPIFFVSANWIQTNQYIQFPNRVMLASTLEAIRLGDGSIIPVKRYIELDYTNKLHKREKIINSNGLLSIMYIKHLHKIVVFDDRLFESFFIQLYLEDYDKKLFESIYLSPTIKIYKLK